MAQEEEVSDEELVQRFCAGHEAAFDDLYHRYDREVLAAIWRGLGRVRNQASLARQIADDFWIRLVRHREWVKKHDPRRCPLLRYLVLLAGRQVVDYRRGLRTKDEPRTLSLGDRDVADTSAALGITMAEWQEVLAKLPPAEVDFIREHFSQKGKKRSLTPAERKHLQRLIERILNVLGRG